MIYLQKNQPWPKTWVKREAFGPEEEIDKSFRQCFEEARHEFNAKYGEFPTHMLLGKDAMDHLKCDVDASCILWRNTLEKDNDTYCGVIVLYSPHAGMEMLWGGQMTSFTLQLNFVHEVDEPFLISEILNVLKGCPTSRNNGRSRIRRYGWDYLTDRHLGPAPEWMPNVPDMDSWTVNEYQAGHSIAPHIDSPKFADEIKTLSLGVDSKMVFHSPDATRRIVKELPRRSLATFSGELRREWRHSTLPTDEGVRFSIVFRKKI